MDKGGVDKTWAQPSPYMQQPEVVGAGSGRQGFDTGKDRQKVRQKARQKARQKLMSCAGAMVACVRSSALENVKCETQDENSEPSTTGVFSWIGQRMGSGQPFR
jgi:hypothetical protein